MDRQAYHQRFARQALAAKAKLEHEARYRCCDQATHRDCICYASFKCPVHGVFCVGSHD